jgi:hypothetical protein
MLQLRLWLSPGLLSVQYLVSFSVRAASECLWFVQELTFETQYLSAISLVTAILLGNTFAFSFDRQRQIIAEMSEEIFALELLLQELFIEIHEPHLRWRVIKHIK